MRVSTYSEHSRVRERRRLLVGDNWYLRESPSPSSNSAPISQLQQNQLMTIPRPSPGPVSLTPAPVSIMSDPVKPSVMVPVPVTVPSVIRSQVSEPVKNDAVTYAPSSSRGPPRSCERQISRVRSLSVFSSDSHIHRDQDPEDPDNLSIDFNVLDTVLDEYSQDSDRCSQ